MMSKKFEKKYGWGDWGYPLIKFCADCEAYYDFWKPQMDPFTISSFYVFPHR